MLWKKPSLTGAGYVLAVLIFSSALMYLCGVLFDWLFPIEAIPRPAVSELGWRWNDPVFVCMRGMLFLFFATVLLIVLYIAVGMVMVAQVNKSDMRLIQNGEKSGNHL